MGLTNPRSIFGVHSFAPYDRVTGEFYGILRVLGTSSLSLSGELISLNGGSSKYPFAVEDGLITAELELVFREYPSFVFELLLGKKPTEIAAESTGDVGAIANKGGTSVVSATVGIASVTLKAASESELKMGHYIVKAASPTTVDIYVSSNIDFATGTDEDYEDDLLKVTPSPLTIADTSATVDFDNFGITITSGSGTIAMTTGDTAEFDVRPVHTGATTVTIGGASDSFPEFGAFLYAKKSGDKSLMEIDLFRVKAVGMPLGFEENAFSESSVTAQAFLDTARGGVFSMRHVKASV